MRDSLSTSTVPSFFSQKTESEFSARRVSWWTLAAVTLALAVGDNGGRYSTLALGWLSVAIVCAVVGSYAPRVGPALFSDATRALAIGTTFLGAMWLFYSTPREIALLSLTLPLSPAAHFLVCLGLAVVLAVFTLRFNRYPHLSRFIFPAFLVFQVCYGINVVQVAHRGEQDSPQFRRFHVRHDVQIFNQEAARLLLSGKNPYSVRMPNVMGQDMPFYPPRTTGPDGKLPFGYVYMPLGAFFLLPGYLLGDFRYAHVFALIGTAFFLAYARPSATSKLAAAFLLLFPQTFFVLVLSWTEPVPLFFLAATLFCFFRAPRWLPLALGCLICAKQYTVFLLPILPLLVNEPREWRPLALKAVGIAALLTLPLALWDIPGFYRSAVAMQFKQPFRLDSLSYLVGLLKLGGPQLSPAIGFAALLGGLAVAFKKAPRDASSWCAAAAVAYLGFFAFNKQAFANYYFWVFGLLVASVAVALPATEFHGEKSRENQGREG